MSASPMVEKLANSRTAGRTGNSRTTARSSTGQAVQLFCSINKMETILRKGELVRTPLIRIQRVGHNGNSRTNIWLNNSTCMALPSSGMKAGKTQKCSKMKRCTHPEHLTFPRANQCSVVITIFRY